MFPRKKSIVTVEGFTKSFVDIKEIPNLLPTGSSGTDATSPVKGFKVKCLQDTPMYYHNKQKPGDMSGYCLDSFVIYPGYFYDLGYLPEEVHSWSGDDNDIRWKDVTNADIYYTAVDDPTPLMFALQLPEDTPVLNGIQSETDSDIIYEYYIKFIARSGDKTIVFTKGDGLVGPFTLYTAPNFTAGHTYLIHIVGDNITILQDYVGQDNR